MTTGLILRRTPVCHLLLLLTLVAAPSFASGTSVVVGKPTGNGTKSSGGGTAAAPKGSA